MNQNIMNSLILFVLIGIYGTHKVSGNSESDLKQDVKAESSSNAAPVFPANEIKIHCHLYTPTFPKEACYFEPEDYMKCAFHPDYELKIIIHGFEAQILPGNYFGQIKDTLLTYHNYNVIIVDWTKYNRQPYTDAVAYAYEVGVIVGKLINDLVRKGLNPSLCHIIGHGLGAHIAGVAGKLVFNLGRITGLVPVRLLFNMSTVYNRLTYDSADFVDVIHTSNYETGIGFGFEETIGTIDFYPNGGNVQPECHMGKQFHNADSEIIIITTEKDLASCYHHMALVYFLKSIHYCNYFGVECESYETYLNGSCNKDSNRTNRMGFFCTKLPGLPKKCKFFFKTTDVPHCATEELGTCKAVLRKMIHPQKPHCGLG